MQKYFSEYKVEIIDHEFIKEGFSYPKTVIISFFNKDKKQIAEEQFGYADSLYVNEYIKQNSELQLDFAFVENFDIEFLRKKVYSQKIILENFSAKNAFFSSEAKDINFSEMLFKNKIVDFSGTYFIANRLNFSASSFYSEETDFSDCFFNCNTINFSKSKFPEGNVLFKNSYFKNGTKSFENIEFLGTKVNFVNVEFNDGDVLFTDTKFSGNFVNFKVADFGTGRIDFSRVVFGKEETSFEKVNFGDGDISFRSADFQNGKINFTSATFGTGKKSFINTNFGNGNLYFKNVDFSDGAVSFRLANFGSGATDFHFCEFGKGNIQFDRSVFMTGELNMKAVNFGTGKISFVKTYFGDNDITFEGASLKGNFLIKDSVLGKGEFNFTEAEFKNSDVEINNVDFGIGKISFYKSEFRNLSLKGSQLDNFFNLQIASCKMLDLSNTVVKDIIDIYPPDFDPNIEAIDLSGMRLLGRIYVDWRRSKLKELIYKQKSTIKSKEEQFRILKENYNVTGQYSYEDEAYVEFKRTEALARLKEDLKQKAKYKKIFAYINYAFKWLVFDKMGKFATDPLRVLSTMILTYLSFTFLYFILAKTGEIHIVSSLFEPEDPRVLSAVGRAFYHSAITFLTIGYGDYYPEGISRWISSVEGFVGLFLMSYFTVAFVRKILR